MCGRSGIIICLLFLCRKRNLNRRKNGGKGEGGVGGKMVVLGRGLCQVDAGVACTLLDVQILVGCRSRTGINRAQKCNKTLTRQCHFVA